MPHWFWLADLSHPFGVMRGHQSALTFSLREPIPLVALRYE